MTPGFTNALKKTSFTLRQYTITYGFGIAFLGLLKERTVTGSSFSVNEYGSVTVYHCDEPCAYFTNVRSVVG